MGGSDRTYISKVPEASDILRVSRGICKLCSRGSSRQYRIPLLCSWIFSFLPLYSPRSSNTNSVGNIFESSFADNSKHIYFS